MTYLLYYKNKLIAKADNIEQVKVAVGVQLNYAYESLKKSTYPEHRKKVKELNRVINATVKKLRETKVNGFTLVKVG